MTTPDTFRVERSIQIDAAPADIAPLIVDFHRWTAWSPWEKLGLGPVFIDPRVPRSATPGGPPSRPAARFARGGQGLYRKVSINKVKARAGCRRLG
jgi:hypothetical protein